MRSHLGAGALGLIVFFVVAALMLVVIPPPFRPVDYFLAGAVGTLFALITVFVVHLATAKPADTFYKKRRKQK